MDYKAKVIVNADDFGNDQQLNAAILKSFDLGLISTSTLLCNRPGFNEACELVHQNKLTDRMGIHLNLTLGQPLSEPIKKHLKFYSHGQMYHSVKGHFLTTDESSVVYKEFQAQIDRCKHEGINPTHIDSHHGVHNYWGVGKVVIELALRNNIPAVRLRVNWGKISKKGRKNANKFYNLRGKIYSAIHNYRLHISGLAKTKYFCEIMNVTPELLSKDTFIEINTHPILNNENIIIDGGSGENLMELKKKLFPADDFRTYNSIKGARSMALTLFHLTTLAFRSF
jgi:chitin disaccharide deacetylase